VTDAEMRLNELLDKLRERECRITPQRIALLRLIIASETHPTATELYEQLRVHYPTTSLATVYKTLNLLKEMGEVLELNFGEGEHHYDGLKPSPHPHVVCVRCHAIRDAEVPIFEDLAHQVATNTGFHITSHRLDFFGICPRCQEAAME